MLLVIWFRYEIIIIIHRIYKSVIFILKLYEVIIVIIAHNIDVLNKCTYRVLSRKGIKEKLVLSWWFFKE